MTLPRPHHIEVTGARDGTATQWVRVEPAGRIFVISRTRHTDGRIVWDLCTLYETAQRAADYVAATVVHDNVQAVDAAVFAAAVRSLREETARIPLW